MTKYVKNPEVLCKDIDNEKVFLNPKTGEYFGVNGVGADIWSMIDGNNDLTMIVDALMEIYQVDRPLLEADAAEFIAALLERKIIIEA